MNRPTVRLIPAAAVVALPLVALSAGVASAAVTPHAATLAKYQIVTTVTNIAAGSAAVGFTTCPNDESVVGGGVTGVTRDETVGSSYPTSRSTWGALYHNRTSSTSSFKVWAVCVKSVAKYSITYGAATDNPAGSQRFASVSCPSGTVALGGGAKSTSTDVAVNINSASPVPDGSGFGGYTNNAGSGSNAVQSVAVCGKKPNGYAVVTGPSTTIPANTQTSAAANCSSGHVLGGGAFSGSGSTAVSLNALYPSSTTAWTAFENNFSSVADTLTAYAICATAKTA